MPYEAIQFNRPPCPMPLFFTSHIWIWIFHWQCIIWRANTGVLDTDSATNDAFEEVYVKSRYQNQEASQRLSKI